MTIKAINVRNQFRGTVKEIIEGPVPSETDVQAVTRIVTSVTTTCSVKELELATDSEVIAFVKSTKVPIAKLWRWLRRVCGAERGGNPEGAPPFPVVYR